MLIGGEYLDHHFSKRLQMEPKVAPENNDTLPLFGPVSTSSLHWVSGLLQATNGISSL